MGSHLIEPRDLSFLLFDWLQVEALTRHAPFAAHDRTTFEHALGTARAVAEDHCDLLEAAGVVGDTTRVLLGAAC